MSKVVKKIGKAVKSVFKGVKKVFKEVTKSKIGKALLIGGAIFLGGAALGFWNAPQWVPFSSKINGAFVKGATDAAATTAAGADAAGKTVAAAGSKTATATEKLGSMVGKDAATLSGGTATGSATVPASALPKTAVEMGANTGPVQSSAYTSNGAKWNSLVNKAAGSPQYGPTGIPDGSFGIVEGGTAGGGAGAASGAAAGAKPGLIGKMTDGVGKVGKFVNDNPIPSMMMMNAAASMAAPDEYDILEKQRQAEKAERERREKNYDVAGIDLGIAPTPRRFTWRDGTPVFENGLIGRGST